MSIKHMNAVFELPNDTTPAERLVLLALADIADENGYCWPSAGYIAKRCGLTKTAVRSNIKKSIGKKRLRSSKQKRSNGSYMANAYQLLIFQKHPAQQLAAEDERQVVYGEEEAVNAEGGWVNPLGGVGHGVGEGRLREGESLPVMYPSSTQRLEYLEYPQKDIQGTLSDPIGSDPSQHELRSFQDEVIAYWNSTVADRGDGMELQLRTPQTDTEKSTRKRLKKLFKNRHFVTNFRKAFDNFHPDFDWKPSLHAFLGNNRTGECIWEKALMGGYVPEKESKQERAIDAENAHLDYLRNQGN